ncbi:4Fe-4S ferredoxin [Paucidesulfovibrio longus]|uniref:4Fe-4S ferredoxin n=1 Tax=Paucidesulfovibrio longus TaxID=889 RepID=UPI0003B5CFCD|nr:4Fe-4S ferredoxin [Paucidesulfovibrio longus]
MSDQTPEFNPDELRQSMDADIVCVGYGPATAGFLATLAPALMNEDGTPIADSQAMPGMPPQVLCYERADDIGFGVSGIVTKGRGIRASFPDLDLSRIPMACEVREEKVVYLFDHIGASRKSTGMKCFEALLSAFKREHAAELPWIPPFLEKKPGMILSMGQFLSWTGNEIMGSGMAQIWPGMPVEKALIEGGRVAGVRLVDQGVAKDGAPEGAYMPGMDVKARLTVVGDGPVGPVGRGLDQHFGLPEGNHQREWAVGMKMVVDLPEGCALKEGTVLHTLGFPEPEIFGFLYVYPGNVASLGIFVPSWFDSPVRTAYRYLQHWMQHPYLWKHLKGGTLRSWGAKSIQEAGRRGEPFLAGDGWARIGEGSGTTNVLTGSGVDEAWTSGVQLGEAVIDLLRQGRDFTRENLEVAYVARRRASWLDEESRQAEKARDGFQKGMLTGLVGMALSGLTKGALNLSGPQKRVYERLSSPESYFRGLVPAEEIARLRQECKAQGRTLHDALMDRAGWPAIPYDGRLLVSHQDALLMGGKVQANPGFADHVRFADPAACERCKTNICAEVCSGQAITVNPDGPVPLFDREKCVHCGACMWNCTQAHKNDPEQTNVEFHAGSGGLHSAEN